MFDRLLAIETLVADGMNPAEVHALTDDELCAELAARDICYLFGEDD